MLVQQKAKKETGPLSYFGKQEADNEELHHPPLRINVRQAIVFLGLGRREYTPIRLPVTGVPEAISGARCGLEACGLHRLTRHQGLPVSGQPHNAQINPIHQTSATALPADSLDFGAKATSDDGPERTPHHRTQHHTFRCQFLQPTTGPSHPHAAEDSCRRPSALSNRFTNI
ncbi:uncharacterized protein QC763_0041870 [Podospora pseudopauciseta]|uniref:Uncharacterized protein n=2 Tax=Podospora TaxID=5144 RepID=A0ABR0HQW2_9PEZI|nr:hypothetical protein QC763_0041870 [Podospora pseudopauciseta]KAK4680194.1 hypothetical protein QC764_0042540 [Podospora pseudoanserina]